MRGTPLMTTAATNIMVTNIMTTNIVITSMDTNKNISIKTKIITGIIVAVTTDTLVMDIPVRHIIITTETTTMDMARPTILVIVTMSVQFTPNVSMMDFTEVRSKC